MKSLLVSDDLVEGLSFPSEDRGEDQTSMSRFEVFSSKLSPLTKRDKRSLRADWGVNGALFFLEGLSSELLGWGTCLGISSKR